MRCTQINCIVVLKRDTTAAAVQSFHGNNRHNVTILIAKSFYGIDVFYTVLYSCAVYEHRKNVSNHNISLLIYCFQHVHRRYQPNFLIRICFFFQFFTPGIKLQCNSLFSGEYTSIR